MTLIFVYNAKSGWNNSVIDIAHKLFKPSTYQCQLCTITHDTFTENKMWKSFTKTSKINFEFLHSDEFEAKHGEIFDYPIIIELEEVDFSVFMSTSEINQLKSTEGLITKLKVLTSLEA